MSAGVALTVAIAVAAFRAIYASGYMAPGFQIIFPTQYRIDAILVGCLLAFAMRDERFVAHITRHSASIFWMGASAICQHSNDVWRCQAIPPLHENIALALMRLPRRSAIPPPTRQPHSRQEHCDLKLFYRPATAGWDLCLGRASVPLDVWPVWDTVAAGGCGPLMGADREAIAAAVALAPQLQGRDWFQAPSRKPAVE